MLINKCLGVQGDKQHCKVKRSRDRSCALTTTTPSLSGSLPLLRRDDSLPTQTSNDIANQPQSKLIAQSKNRFRMKLHGSERQAGMLDRHDDPVIALSCHSQHIWKFFSHREERMVAGGGEFI